MIDGNSSILKGFCNNIEMCYIATLRKHEKDSKDDK